MRKIKIDPSVPQLTEQYFNSKKLPSRKLTSFYFCDNKKDVNECADPVLNGIKRATASSLWGYEENNEDPPKKNDLFVVIDWARTAQCIIQINKVEILPFNKATSEFAQEEGEGDKSLEYWKKYIGPIIRENWNALVIAQ